MMEMWHFSVSAITLLLCVVIAPTKGAGDFWFISDFHVDQNYSRNGNPDKLCHQEKMDFPDNGIYGNFLCDSPLTLVDATVIAMKAIQPEPDFIVWTGDNLPHTRGFTSEWNVVFDGIKNITDDLKASFLGVPIYPSIGNHDTSPKNVLQVSATKDGIYEDYLVKAGWNKILSEKAQISFKQGGYYSEEVKPGLRLISLNTILWYSSNKFNKDLRDPNDQLKWLGETLESSLKNKEKVYIIGHVAPGFYNRNDPGKKSDPTYHLQFLEKYLELLNKYSNIIAGQMYGHVHNDYFQVFNFNTKDYKSSSIVASSVTPWHYTSKNNITLPVNPSIKLMQYSEPGFLFKDFDVYYLDLSAANKKNKTQEANMYEHLYKFTEAYGVPDLTTKSLAKVYDMLKRNETVFKTFFRLMTAGKESAPCEKECQVAQLCSMSGISAREYDTCMESGAETSVPSTSSANTVIAVTITVLLVILIASFIGYQQCWKRNRCGYRQEV